MKQTFLNWRFAFAIVLFWGSTVSVLQGQIIYAWTFDDIFIKIDVANCTVCKTGQFNNAGNGDLVVMPDGTVITSGAANQILTYTPPDPNLSQSVSGPGNHFYYTMSEPLNGIVYVYTSIIGPGTTGITAYDPVAGTLNYVGNFPNNWSLGGFFVENNTLYAVALIGNDWSIIEVNTANPSQSIILSQGNTPLPFGSTGGDVCSGVYTTAAHPSREILFAFDPATNDTTRLCDFRDVGFINQIRGLSVAPVGLPEFPCVCVTTAGALDTATLNRCVPNSAFGYATQNPVLDVGHAVRYILFTDPADTLGSIIVIRSTPGIPFDPATMQAGTVYYYAVMAGPLLPNGNLDTGDPCFDISNAVSVIWREKPAVLLSVLSGDLCRGGCATVSATFTGTPPFTLTYTAPGVGPTTQSFSSNTGTFQVCVPANAPLGGFVVQATALTDAFCNCQ